LDEDLGLGSADGHAKVLVVCLMPDHVHLMLLMDGKGRPFWDYVRYWKTRWTKRLSAMEERPFWQRSCYDHWMRQDEASSYAAYIVNNPVRKALAQNWREYPYTRVYIPL